MPEFSPDKYYLVAERGGMKVVILSSENRRLLEDLGKVVSEKNRARGTEFKWEIIPGLNYHELSKMKIV